MQYLEYSNLILVAVLLIVYVCVFYCPEERIHFEKISEIEITFLCSLYFYLFQKVFLQSVSQCIHIVVSV